MKTADDDAMDAAAALGLQLAQAIVDDFVLAQRRMATGDERTLFVRALLAGINGMCHHALGHAATVRIYAEIAAMPPPAGASARLQ